MIHFPVGCTQRLQVDGLMRSLVNKHPQVHMGLRDTPDTCEIFRPAWLGDVDANRMRAPRTIHTEFYARSLMEYRQ